MKVILATASTLEKNNDIIISKSTLEREKLRKQVANNLKQICDIVVPFFYNLLRWQINAKNLLKKCRLHMLVCVCGGGVL